MIDFFHISRALSADVRRCMCTSLLDLRTVSPPSASSMDASTNSTTFHSQRATFSSHYIDKCRQSSHRAGQNPGHLSSGVLSSGMFTSAFSHLEISHLPYSQLMVNRHSHRWKTGSYKFLSQKLFYCERCRCKKEAM